MNSGVSRIQFIAMIQGSRGAMPKNVREAAERTKPIVMTPIDLGLNAKRAASWRDQRSVDKFIIF
jgi:hypothetical protein